MQNWLPLYYSLVLGVTGVCAVVVLNHMGQRAGALARIGYVLLAGGCFGEIAEWWWIGEHAEYSASILLHAGLSCVAVQHVLPLLGVFKKELYHGTERRHRS